MAGALLFICGGFNAQMPCFTQPAGGY